MDVELLLAVLLLVPSGGLLRAGGRVDTDKPPAPMSWMQRLKRVFAIDIETCPERRLSGHGGLRAGSQEALPAAKPYPRSRLHARRLHSGTSWPAAKPYPRSRLR
jgi:hypothetical protein